MPDDKLVSAVKAALKGGVQVVQIWNPDMAPSKNLLETCKEIIFATKTAKIPLIVNNNLELAKLLGADGIHFDDFSKSAKDARIILGEHAIVGYTCGNDQSLITRAAEFGADYISFCAVFPSPSVQSCEIVPLESVRRAKELVTIPVFASGGITLQNAHLVMEAGADGLAIASSILRADDPERQADAFRTIINRYLTAE
jgi:thiamine-phosphate pyrophosphorylase